MQRAVQRHTGRSRRRGIPESVKGFPDGDLFGQRQKAGPERRSKSDDRAADEQRRRDEYQRS